MERIAFTMRLRPGAAADYQRRHDAIWPDLADLLKGAGIARYGIYLGSDGITLFAALEIADRRALDDLPQHPVMRRWWSFMADLMETHADDAPLVEPLREVFYLP
jgi:L-rhamnose mutarotase